MTMEELTNHELLCLFASAVDDDDAEYIAHIQEEIYMRMEDRGV